MNSMILKSIHKEFKNKLNLVSNPNPILIEGEYYYYNTSTELGNDKVHYLFINLFNKNWGGRYRAQQTLISWFFLNGYANVEIPKIDVIQSNLVYLGQYPSSFKEKNQNINISNIAMVVAYLIDIEIEILLFNNIQQLKSGLSSIHELIQELKCPIIMLTNSFYTILGVDLISFDKNRLLILNHTYSGANNIFQITRSGNISYNFIIKN
jgi:hypothetical protein